jgi:hypothetical protein
MEERLFFYRIHVDGAGIAIDQGMINAPAILPDLTFPSPANPYLALAGTKGALNSALAQRDKIGGRFGPNKSLAQFLGLDLAGKKVGLQKGQTATTTKKEAGLATTS